MSNIEKYDVSVGSGIISVFQSQSYKLERVMAEFIDNSLQSFLDHEDVLKEIIDGNQCVVDIKWDDNKITIKDNAFGMSQEEFGRALKLKSFNPRANEKDRLSVYGMGLKYAAVYLGNTYKITSTMYGESKERTATIDVPTFERDNPSELQAIVGYKDADCHYTTVEITNLRVKKTEDKINKLRQNLGIIYEHYIFHKKLVIVVNNIRVNYEKPEFRKDEQGCAYCRTFEGELVAKNTTYKYSGWVGILAKGNQDITGIKLVQADRCIQLGYKPEKIFNKGNSFQNSRLIGEIVFEGNQSIVSFDKDQFIWADDGTEEAFVDQLLSNDSFKEMKKMCQILRKETDSEKIKNKTAISISKNAKNDTTPSSNSETKVNDNDSITSTQNNPTANEQNITVDQVTVIQDKEGQSNEVKTTFDKINSVLESKEINLNFIEFEKDGNKTKLYYDLVEDLDNNDWIKLDKLNNDYVVKINYKNKFIEREFKTEKAIISTNKMAIKLVKSLLMSKDLGVNTKQIESILNNFNLELNKE